MNDGRTTTWMPGQSRGDRGYTRAEARVAVGGGWGDLAAAAWSAVVHAGGRVTRVGSDQQRLVVQYQGLPQEERLDVEAALVEFARTSELVCEDCGRPRYSTLCPRCAWKAPVPVEESPAFAFREELGVVPEPAMRSRQRSAQTRRGSRIP